jgi:hypothetical protein
VWDEEQRIRNLGGFVTLDGRVCPPIHSFFSELVWHPIVIRCSLVRSLSLSLSRVSSRAQVMGRLAVSRAMGDLEMAPFISCDPFIYPWKITPKVSPLPFYSHRPGSVWKSAHASPSGRVHCNRVRWSVGCDYRPHGGTLPPAVLFVFFSVFNLHSALQVQLVQPHISCPEYAATKLRDHALFYGSTDNISAIVINLQSSAKGAATTKTRRTKNSL